VGIIVVVLLCVLGALAAGLLLGRYYVPDDRQLRRTARHSQFYMRAVGHLINRDREAAITELRRVVDENVDDTEPYFALGALFRARGEHERAIRVHQALALREKDHRRLQCRAMFELALDFRSAGMPRRATRALETVISLEPGHRAALRTLAAMYEEQGHYEAAAKATLTLSTDADVGNPRAHALLIAAASDAIVAGELDEAKQLLQTARRQGADNAQFFVAAAELAAARGDHLAARERWWSAVAAMPSMAVMALPKLAALPVQALLPTSDEPPVDGQEAVTPASTAQRIAAIEERLGPRLEFALLAKIDPSLLIRDDLTTSVESIEVKFAHTLTGQVLNAQKALASNDAASITRSLAELVGPGGGLHWATSITWQCQSCGLRSVDFVWRCGQCRSWSTMTLAAAVEPWQAVNPQVASSQRDRRANTRREQAWLPAVGLAAPRVATEFDAPRRSLLGRARGWLSRRHRK
jgi:lipopolysaccharide assembly protein B